MKNLTAQDKLFVQRIFTYFKTVHGYYPSSISDFPPGTFTKSEMPYAKKYSQAVRENPFG